ncbi:fungal-specific transcription factor domain-containing protein [Mycena sanguinolenta]|nr:fungal-specific transcription factor domain-containing protein [Mycena sanguinolenta]
MSVSGELEFVYEDVLTPKKQRHRACDPCRQLKRRCDGNTVCNHCAKCNIACTYVQPIRPRPRRPQNSRDSAQPLSSECYGYVKELKERLQDVKAAVDHLEQPPTTDSEPSFIDYAIMHVTKPSISLHSDSSKAVDIIEDLRSLSLGIDPGFQGQSSAAVLVDLAVSIKPSHATQETISGLNFPARTLKSPEIPPHNLFFPNEHLMKSLISHYFANANGFLPLLHRSRFVESIKQRLQFHHHGFASTLLLVCALGSLYLSGKSAKEAQELAWLWYNQVELCGHSPRQRPTLYDLQAYCLAAEFLYFTSNSRVCWSIVGFGLRVGEDIGAHRQRNRTTSITTEEELEKRAMWILLILDTHLGDTLGRGRVVNQRDMDMVLPCEFADDSQIWGPEHNKPEDRPTTFFISVLTLSRIVQFTLSTLYCGMMDREMTGLADCKVATTELDSALEKWFDQVPRYLQWDADRPDSPIARRPAGTLCTRNMYKGCTRMYPRC